MAYAHRISPGQKVDLKDYDPAEDGGISKEEAEAKLHKLGQEMEKLQDLLYSAGRTALLVVLQGLDTSGKDGTIRHLLRYVNAQSCRVASFKVPTAKELGHDFLWRIHCETPIKGSMTIFNRSHYEDVLVARVHELAAKDVIKERYEHINNFEQLLADSGTIILKFYLHIDKKEQEQRLLAREQDPEKSWKLSVGDWKERELWGDYRKAYEAMLSHCSCKDAPWFVVPSNHKWYRDLAITETIIKALEPHKDGWMEYLKELGTKEKKELEEFRRMKRENGG